MPSGAKKRKQAKKKKEQQAHSNTNNSSSISDAPSQGNDDPRSQDERDSDSGEMSSPASQDHQNKHHPFNKEAEKSVQSSFVTEDSSVGVEGKLEGSQNTFVENESVVEIQREVNLEDMESVDFKLEHSHNGHDKSSRSSSSSSSSDDESQAVDDKQMVEIHYSASDVISFDDVEKVEEVKEDSTIEKPITKANGNSVTETASPMDRATPAMPMSEVAKLISEGSQFENVIESEFKENEDKLLPKSDIVAGQVLGANEENNFPILNQNAEASTTVSTSHVINGKEDRLPESSSSQTSFAENIKDSKASSAAHTYEVGKDIEAKDFEASENNETEPVVPPAPQIAQRTSFLSCCGLFDVLTGSNR